MISRRSKTRARRGSTGRQRLSLWRRQWLAPFIFVGLVALAPMRSPPVFPPPPQNASSRTRKGWSLIHPDPVPRRGEIVGGTSFLETTHAPETLVKAGGERQGSRQIRLRNFIARIYPEVLNNDALEFTLWSWRHYSPRIGRRRLFPQPSRSIAARWSTRPHPELSPREPG